MLIADCRSFFLFSRKFLEHSSYGAEPNILSVNRTFVGKNILILCLNFFTFEWIILHFRPNILSFWPIILPDGQNNLSFGSFVFMLNRTFSLWG